MRRVAAILALSAIALTGCSGWTGSGTVSGKTETPEGVGVVQECHTMIKAVCYGLKERKVKIPASWKIKVKDGSGQEHEIEVDQETYNNVEIGEGYTKS